MISYVRFINLIDFCCYWPVLLARIMQTSEKLNCVTKWNVVMPSFFLIYFKDPQASMQLYEEWLTKRSLPTINASLHFGFYNHTGIDIRRFVWNWQCNFGFFGGINYSYHRLRALILSVQNCRKLTSMITKLYQFDRRMFEVMLRYYFQLNWMCALHVLKEHKRITLTQSLQKLVSTKLQLSFVLKIFTDWHVYDYSFTKKKVCLDWLWRLVECHNFA